MVAAGFLLVLFNSFFCCLYRLAAYTNNGKKIGLKAWLVSLAPWGCPKTQKQKKSIQFNSKKNNNKNEKLKNLLKLVDKIKGFSIEHINKLGSQTKDMSQTNEEKRS